MKVIDGNGTVTRHIYSDRDLPTAEVSEVSGTTSFVYNEHAQLTRETDAQGVTVARTIDALNRVGFVDYPEDDLDISFTYGDPEVQFSNGRLTAVTRNGESIEYRYDRFGRRTQDGALIFSYDKNGNRRTVDYPGGIVATYTYDFVDRQSSLMIQEGTNPPQAIVNAATYKPSGPLSSLSLGNGLVESRLFDARYFPSVIQVGGVLSWSYATDAVGNILAITDQSDPTSSRVYGYQDYQYYLASGVGPWGSLGWTYDRLGNRLTETRDGSTTTYTYSPNAAGNSSPKLASMLGDGANDTPTRYYYDRAGNLIQESRDDSKIGYRYNSEKRLSEILRDSANKVPSETQLSYDGRSYLSESTLVPFLGLLGEEVRNWVTRATYSSEGVLHQRSIERHATPASPRNTPTTEGDDYLFYFFGRPVARLGLRSVTQADGQITTSRALNYLSTDHLGTPILATSGPAVVEWAGGFEPFGMDFLNAQGAGVFISFPGQWNDETWAGLRREPGISYNLHRWYTVAAGRYAKPDPLRYPAPGAEETPFSYARVNPLLNFDSLGLCTCNDDCPGGEWGYSGLGASIAFIWGVSRSWGTFTCRSNGFKFKAKSKCKLGGITASIGFGPETSLGFPAACGCNKRDLLGDSDPFFFSAGIVGANIDSCFESYQRTVTWSLFKSIGFSFFGGTKCETERRE